MKKTPISKLIEWADSVPYKYMIPIEDIKAKATELLAEEREAIEKAYIKGDKAEFFRHCQDLPPEDNSILAQNYFTQTYGGGDE